MQSSFKFILAFDKCKVCSSQNLTPRAAATKIDSVQLAARHAGYSTIEHVPLYKRAMEPELLYRAFYYTQTLEARAAAGHVSGLRRVLRWTKEGIEEAILIAIKTGHVPALEHLLDEYTSPEACFTLIKSATKEVVCTLMEHEIWHRDYVLLWAAFYGRLDVVQVCLELGADVHSMNGRALVWAAESGHVHVMELLAQHEADIHVSDDLALCCAARNGHEEAVSWLLARGARADARGGIARYWARQQGRLSIAALLQ